jgi:hypothetical protein
MSMPSPCGREGLRILLVTAFFGFCGQMRTSSSNLAENAPANDRIRASPTYLSPLRHYARGVNAPYIKKRPLIILISCAQGTSADRLQKNPRQEGGKAHFRPHLSARVQKSPDKCGQVISYKPIGNFVADCRPAFGFGYRFFGEYLMHDRSDRPFLFRLVFCQRNRCQPPERINLAEDGLSLTVAQVPHEPVAAPDDTGVNFIGHVSQDKSARRQDGVVLVN